MDWFVACVLAAMPLTSAAMFFWGWYRGRADREAEKRAEEASKQRVNAGWYEHWTNEL